MDAFIGPDPLLLDTYSGASIAYSLRKLRTDYSGACIRVRRSSDNTEQDIGFANNVLDTATLLTFCGAGNGFVTAWYDQSTNANNATQATTTLQPQIVASGAVLTQGSLPAVRSTSQRLMFSQVPTAAFSTFAVAKVDATGGASFMSYLQNHSMTGGVAGFKILSKSGSAYQSTLVPYIATTEQTANARAMTTSLSVPTARFLESWSYSPGSLRQNGAAQTIDSNALSGWSNGVAAIGSMDYLGAAAGITHLQEVILFATNRASDAAAIESNMNSYWGVY